MAPAIAQELAVDPLLSSAPVIVDDLAAIVDDEESLPLLVSSSTAVTAMATSEVEPLKRGPCLARFHDYNTKPWPRYDSIQAPEQQDFHCWLAPSQSNDSSLESMTAGLSDEEKLSEDFENDDYDLDDDDSSGLPQNPLLKAYCAALERNPLWVKSWTAFVLLGCADALAQWIEHIRGLHSQSEVVQYFDIFRMLRFATFGLVGTPWAHYYYTWLDTALPPTSNPWTCTTVLKVCIDQFLQAPLLLALIIIGMGMMQFESYHAIKHDLKQQYVSTLIANCT